jgi:hypothetical protein
MVLKSIRISLELRIFELKPLARDTNDILGTFCAHRIDLVPEFMTPIYELLDIAFNIPGTFPTSHGIYFYCDFFGAKSAQDVANAGFKEGPSVPCHAELDRFRQSRIPAK